MPFISKNFIVYSIFIIFIFFSRDAVFAISTTYPPNTPSGYKKEMKGKYRVIEHSNNFSTFFIYDSNKIKTASDGSITIFPPVYVQEYFGSGWSQRIEHEVIEPIFVLENTAIIGIEKQQKRTLDDAGKKNDDIGKIFKDFLISIDLNKSSKRLFIDIVSSKKNEHKGSLKVMTTTYFVNLPRDEKIGLMQTCWRVWNQVYTARYSGETMLAFVDRNNKLLGYAKGETPDLIVVK